MSLKLRHTFTFLTFCLLSFSSFTQSSNDPYSEGQKSFESGDVYNGEFSHGTPNGKGLMKFKGGDEYLGEFKNGKMDGKGAILLVTGDSYHGDWQDGEAHGKGTYKKNDGSSFKGNFKNGMRQGNGIVTWKTGDTLKGTWEDDKLDGKAIFEFANGDQLETQWHEGSMKVKSIYTRENGQKIQGSMNTIYMVAEMEDDFAETKEEVIGNLQIAWMSSAMEFKASQNYDLAMDFLMAAQRYGTANPEHQAVIAQQIKAIDSQKNNSGWAQLPKK